MGDTRTLPVLPVGSNWQKRNSGNYHDARHNQFQLVKYNAYIKKCNIAFGNSIDTRVGNRF